MADFIQGLKDWFLNQKYLPSGEAPNHIAQDRYTRTPIFFGTPQAGTGGNYDSSGEADQRLKGAINGGPPRDLETLRGLDNLVNEWAGLKGTIRLSDNAFGRGSGQITHEVAHKIYDKAGLKDIAPELLKYVPEGTKRQLLESDLYSRMPKPYAGSPEQLTDEGLGFAFTAPGGDDQKYINKVAEFIKDPKLKEALLRMQLNRLAVDKNPKVRWGIE